MSGSTEQQIRELITEINNSGNKFVASVNELNTNLWQYNRTRFLQIDDLGGHSVLGYKHDKDFLATEIPQFHAQWIMIQRTTGRIERVLGLPVGTVSSDYFQPFRQFRVRKNKGQSNTGSGTTANPEGENKIKEAWAIACELAAPDFPSKTHIEQAVAQMAEEGKAKAIVNRCSLARKSRYFSKQQFEELQARCKELEEENQELTDYKEFVDAENERLRTELKRYRSIVRSVA